MREKLIELLEKAHDLAVETCGSMNKGFGAWYADHLIANGVTFATDNNIGDKWIPVTERLPKDSERVLAYHDDGLIRFGICKGGFADVVSTIYLQNHCRTCFSKVTHWMPLPEPPKGE